MIFNQRIYHAEPVRGVIRQNKGAAETRPSLSTASPNAAPCCVVPAVARQEIGGMLMRSFLFVVVVLALALPLPLAAEEERTHDHATTESASAQERIPAGQHADSVPDTSRFAMTGDAEGDAARNELIFMAGGASLPDIWRGPHFDTSDVTVSTGGDVDKVLVQEGGMRWQAFRAGPLSSFGAWLLLGTIAALTLFYLLRGRIMVAGALTGRMVTRFRSIERMAHWLLAGSFILLAVTGLLLKYGRGYIAPLFGNEFNATLLLVSKLIHNNVAWLFMLSLSMIFFLWVRHNLPHRTDLTWFAQAGGLLGEKHPPARKFNAGQKLIFWSVILLGGLISLTGLSLLFPFELPLFAKPFAALNSLGIPGLLGIDEFPVSLAPQEEMALAQAWHVIVSFVLMAIILAHIYLGSVGMQGAYAAMGSGKVDEAWAHQHHSLWLDELKAKKEKDAPKPATPAE